MSPSLSVTSSSQGSSAGVEITRRTPSEQGVTGTCVGHRDMACRIARINARKERKTHASTQKAAEKACRVYTCLLSALLSVQEWATHAQKTWQVCSLPSVQEGGVSVKFQPAFARLGGKLRMDLAAPESGHKWKLFYQKQLVRRGKPWCGTWDPHWSFCQDASLFLLYELHFLRYHVLQDTSIQKGQSRLQWPKSRAQTFSRQLLLSSL